MLISSVLQSVASPDKFFLVHYASDSPKTNTLSSKDILSKTTHVTENEQQEPLNVALTFDRFGHVIVNNQRNIPGRQWKCEIRLKEFLYITKVKDGAYYCYCAYVLRTSSYSGFP